MGNRSLAHYKAFLLAILMAVAALVFLQPGTALAGDEEDKSYNEQVIDDLMYYKYSFEQGNIDVGAMIDHLQDALDKLNLSDVQDYMRDDIRQVVRMVAAGMADLPAGSISARTTKTKVIISLGEKTLPEHYRNVILKAEKLYDRLAAIGLDDMVQLLQESRPKDVIGLTIPEGYTREGVQVILPLINVDDFEGLEGYSLLVKGNEVTFKVPLKILRSKEGGGSLSFSYKTIEPAPLSIPGPNALKSAVYDIDIYWQRPDGSRVDKQTSQVMLTLPYRQGEVADPLYLGVFTYNEAGCDWNIVQGSFSSPGQVEISLVNPGKYAVLEYKKTFADIAGHWAEKDIVYMASRQIVQGLLDDLFLPDNPATRAQFAAMVLRTFGGMEITPEKPTFVDVIPDSRYFGAVEGAYRAGLVAGIDQDHFAPGQNITREEMAAMIARGLGTGYKTTADLSGALEKLKEFKDYDDLSPWARESMALCYQLGIIKGTPEGFILPKAYATRAEATAMLRRVLNILEADKSTL
ncbi:S-layer homology domain-containing protein [Neomoorella humiferrea]|uniref:Endoglucanase n=1 Tax=Neomoorella humiferrea TaxID=676965 RepID=A0A2T0AUT5_9FIRM|nr:S-layer homology domain-containing protein [Moorella humiferrea]PRR74248.1 Endoglucanase precursor [Moorella humiferrea]